MNTFKVAIVGCGRMGTTIDDEVREHPLYGRLPYSHAACYAAVEETEMVACSDVIEEKVERTKLRYGIPHGYSDYREMIEKEKPDIVSVTTRPVNHAEVSIFCAEHGVKGIYCEKPLCCSMEEADAMLEACEKNNVKFNYGTNRRYQACYTLVRQLVEEGEIGDLRSVIAYCHGSAQWSLTHASDQLLYQSGDSEVEFVRGLAALEEADFADNRVEKDPSILDGYVKFSNGVTGHLVGVSGWDCEVVGSKGRIRTLNDSASLRMQKRMGPANQLCDVIAPVYRHESGGVPCIQDLMDAIENDTETKGNLRLACRSQEIVIGWVESHRLGGRKVELPLQNRSLYVSSG
ncbi:MAG: Gfo/Idh/MocA family oxidoreductase [Planctomycetota bacterium]|jgi:predicted dehydrogenase|nr:Gfo/Idh/MocA family oxidoreductase [Planctomycetota bacterium]MDP7250729.1 Gfo/Idh/MocA family oxidoreductase [Planctomycetota bacterium]